MKGATLVLAAAALLPAFATSAVAGPSTMGAAVTSESLAQEIGWKHRRHSETRDCRPYNGPYGYYGNPYCEGGFTRDGEAGGYEIDLTRFFDSRYYSDDRRDRRRWR
jgi:hypothetical protein